MPRSPAISFKLFQHSASRLTLVLWPAITIELFETGDFTASPPPRISHRYYMTVWLFGQENPRLGATGGFPAEAVSRLDVRQNCYWRSLTLPISASRLNLRCSMMPSLTLRR